MDNARCHYRKPRGWPMLGAFIGAPLGLGPHWYCDLAELRHDYGNWITLTPVAGRTSITAV